ncbi:MAG TPA: hypothetical protein VNN76_05670 [Bacteroidota bacterium]|nr:hypothetical protein [Bacteroidota bacterium]
MARSIAASFESLAKHKGIDLRVECPSEPIGASFDRDAIEKIVTNLFDPPIPSPPT